LVALAVQHLLEQELGDRGVRHREPIQQLNRFSAVLNGQRGQPDTRDPPLRACVQRGGQFGCRFDRRCGEQLPGFVEPEGEISLADLGKAAVRAWTAERNRGIAATDDDGVNRGRKVGEEPPEQSPVVR